MKFIKPIETLYKGYRFRSRLEARWAVFFDDLGIKWEYEKEGFDIAGVRYLPDFWLSTVNMWAEVKPGPFDKAARILAIQLANQTGYDVLLLGGMPENRPYQAAASCGDDLDFCLTNYKNYPRDEHRFYFTTDDPFDLPKQFDDTAAACEAARSARFEYGEHGRRQ